MHDIIKIIKKITVNIQLCAIKVYVAQVQFTLNNF